MSWAHLCIIVDKYILILIVSLVLPLVGKIVTSSSSPISIRSLLVYCVEHDGFFSALLCWLIPCAKFILSSHMVTDSTINQTPEVFPVGELSSRILRLGIHALCTSLPGSVFCLWPIFVQPFYSPQLFLRVVSHPGAVEVKLQNWVALYSECTGCSWCDWFHERGIWKLGHWQILGSTSWWLNRINLYLIHTGKELYVRATGPR